MYDVVYTCRTCTIYSQFTPPDIVELSRVWQCELTIKTHCATVHTQLNDSN